MVRGLNQQNSTDSENANNATGPAPADLATAVATTAVATSEPESTLNSEVNAARLG